MPDRVASLQISLTGEVEKLAQGGAKEQLAQTRAFQLNGIDRTIQVRASLEAKKAGKPAAHA